MRGYMTAATWSALICRTHCEVDRVEPQETWSVAEGSQPKSHPPRYNAV
jgi:hypothetical protein